MNEFINVNKFLFSKIRLPSKLQFLVSKYIFFRDKLQNVNIRLLLYIFNFCKMASFPSQEHRPIKRPRLGAIGPDVYPQEPKQKEVPLFKTMR